MIYPNNLDRNVRGNSVDPDQTAPQEQSDQGLHVLQVVCIKYHFSRLWTYGGVHGRNGCRVCVLNIIAFTDICPNGTWAISPSNI